MDESFLNVAPPLRILAPQLGFDTTLGGGRYDYELLAALARAGHKILVLIPRSHASAVPPGVETLAIEGRARGHAALWNAIFFPKLLRNAAAWKPDLIRVHSPYALGPAALLVGRLTGVPVVGNFFHLGEPAALQRITERWLPPFFDQLNTPGEFTRSQLLARHPRLGRRIFLTPCGISERFFTSEGSRETSADGPLFIHVGALIPRKNLRWLVALFGAWVAQGGPGRLWMVGEGPERPQLESDIAAGRLGERIHLTGRLSDTETLGVMTRAELLLFPSLMEGFGLAVGEALASGLPALVSDRGGLPETVAHAKTGFVLSVDNGFSPWLAAMQRLVADPGLRRRMSTAARVEARARFRWDVIAAQAASGWRTITAEGPRLLQCKP